MSNKKWTIQWKNKIWKHENGYIITKTSLSVSKSSYFSCYQSQDHYSKGDNFDSKPNLREAKKRCEELWD